MRTRQIFYFLISGLLFFGFFSCNDEDITTITGISVSPIEKGVLLVGSTVEFQVRGNNSTDITEDYIIKVDDVTLEDNSFETELEPKTYIVTCFYKDFTDEISIQTDKGFVKNVLVEDYTGTWCVNCPRLSWAIELAKVAAPDKVVAVGIHNFDEMQMEGVDVLIDEFSITTYPTGKINRIYDWESPQDANIDAVTDFTGFGTPLGLAIDSSIAGSTINATIEVGFENTVEIPLNIVVYLTESGLIYDQHNNTPYYGGGSIIVDFEHKDVLRAIVTHHLGESISSSETVADNIYSIQKQIEIPASIQNNDNLHLVAFVTDAITNEVINVREAKVGVVQDLQIVE